MKLRVPNFLNRIDLYLLTHYPNVWATRVHYFVFYSLICGNLLMFLLGYLYPISMANIPSYNNIVGIIDLLLLSGFLVIIYWVYLQIRDAKPMFTLRQIVGTFVIYMLCLVSIVINTLVFGSIIEERIVRLTEKNQLLEDYQYYISQIKLINTLAINRRNELKLIELRNSNLSASGSMERYLDLINELHAAGHPVYLPQDYGRLKPNFDIGQIEASLLNNLKFSDLLKMSLTSELQAWKTGLTDRLSPKSLVLSDKKILEFFDKYEVPTYATREFDAKMKELLSYYSSNYCLARGRYYYYSTYDGGYDYDIPQGELNVLMSFALLIFSISAFTLILRNYKRKTLWIALFCSIGLFIIGIIASEKLLQPISDEMVFSAIHIVFLVICLPVLIRAYFCKRNGWLTIVILVIPLVYIFLWHFIFGGAMFLVPHDEVFGPMLHFEFLASSLIFGLAYFNALVKINRLPA